MTLALDECVEALRRGAPPMACLDLYPDLGRELAPLVALAARIIDIGRTVGPSREFKERTWALIAGY